MADRRRTREQWQSIVEGWSNSGLTQAAYCAQQGISVTSFHRWREQLHGCYLSIMSLARLSTELIDLVPELRPASGRLNQCT
ncbi:IS66 family insertion sequence element accessory protein TnpA [Rhabdochromatium marinum]|uniref:IS66 family insertion sequence element accessory protein TnpA n=1 Tax=Rhabdochromatium marinum TaxID=48729 RepID=UPI003B833A38